MSPRKILRVRCLPVAHGDSLLIEYGDARHPARILVDGGPANRYGVLREAIGSLPASERHFELLIVTHIDADHIDGIVILLQDRKLGATFDDVWFNGWPQLVPPGTRERDLLGPKQGEFVGALLSKQDRAWNRAFGGKAVVLPDDGAAPPVNLAGGATLTLLSPRPEELRRLRLWWGRALREAGMKPGDWSDAMERLEQRKAYQPPETGLPETLAGKAYGSDAAVANGSSIAVLLEYGGRKVVLGADAYPSVLTAAVRREAQRIGQERLRLDALKQPHHGSAANIDAELLDSMECPRFLVSTNGAYFKHPDPPAIRLIGEHAADPEVRFNQLSDTTKRWQEAAAEREDGIHATYPPDGELIELKVS